MKIWRALSWKSYEIADKLFCVTIDNAGNNGTLCESLEGNLTELGIHWDHEVNCVSVDPLIVAFSCSVFHTHH